MLNEFLYKLKSFLLRPDLIFIHFVCAYYAIFNLTRESAGKHTAREKLKKNFKFLHINIYTKTSRYFILSLSVCVSQLNIILTTILITKFLKW